MLFLICTIVIIGTSLTAPPPNSETIRGLTYASLDRAAVRASWERKDVVMTAVVLGLVAAIYVYFTVWLM